MNKYDMKKNTLQPVKCKRDEKLDEEDKEVEVAQARLKAEQAFIKYKEKYMDLYKKIDELKKLRKI
ncbi:MAG: hypothetical protein Q4A42_06150 [Tissierellia bacterium]|nr:hypothetical protein [Tissierellia bacterium]